MELQNNLRINRIKAPHSGDRIISDFSEYRDFLETGAQTSLSRTISLARCRNMTVFVKNHSDGSVRVSAQYSPDGRHYVSDGQVLDLEESEFGYLIPLIFSRYMRLAVSGTRPGRAEVWFQLQGFDYCSYNG